MPGSTADVIVVGSGAAGLAAAIAAAGAGADVLVLEASSELGGTTATSSGMVWIPGNPEQAARGIDDSADAVVTYLRALVGPDLDVGLARAFATHAAPVLAQLTELGLELRGTGLADYHPELDGASASRTMATQPFRPDPLGPLAEQVRRSPHRPSEQDGEWVGGTSLAGQLLAAATKVGVRFELDARVTSLDHADGTITGVTVEAVDGSGSRHYEARNGVVLASAGYEHNAALVSRFVPALEANWTPAHNRGDGLVIGEAEGAALANTGEALWYPLLRVSDDPLPSGQPRFMDASPARTLPGSIIVDRSGRRFASEGANYHDLGRAIALQADDLLPAWLIVDQTFVETYGDRAFGDQAPDPSLLQRVDSIAEVAAIIDADPAVLEATVARFNEGAARGEDPDFGRGSTAFEQGWGDTDLDGPAACLAPLATAPFSVTRTYLGASGTNGGLVIDGDGRVLDQAGAPIDRLFAAGNVVASVSRGSAPAGGSTLGPAIVFGFLAGQAAASTS